MHDIKGLLLTYYKIIKNFIEHFPSFIFCACVWGGSRHLINCFRQYQAQKSMRTTDLSQGIKANNKFVLIKEELWYYM
jgi:hypothetical protein